MENEPQKPPPAPLEYRNPSDEPRGEFLDPKENAKAVEKMAKGCIPALIGELLAYSLIPVIVALMFLIRSCR